MKKRITSLILVLFLLIPFSNLISRGTSEGLKKRIVISLLTFKKLKYTPDTNRSCGGLLKKGKTVTCKIQFYKGEQVVLVGMGDETVKAISLTIFDEKNKKVGDADVVKGIAIPLYVEALNVKATGPFTLKIKLKKAKGADAYVLAMLGYKE